MVGGEVNPCVKQALRTQKSQRFELPRITGLQSGLVYGASVYTSVVVPAAAASHRGFAGVTVRVRSAVGHFNWCGLRPLLAAVIVEDAPLPAIARVYIGLIINDAVAALFTTTRDGFVDTVRS